ncbi:unnamed protein product, partial [Rotaria magnacalcarata]
MDTDKATASIELPMEVDSRWVHMDDIEYEKLEWIKDLSKLSAQQTSDDSITQFKYVSQVTFNTHIALQIFEIKILASGFIQLSKSFFRPSRSPNQYF